MQATLKLNRPQFEFISHPKKFSAFVGGYRSGKTFVGCVRLCINALENPGIPQGYFAPTYPQIADIFYDTMPVVAEAFGLFADIVPSKKRVYLRDNRGRCLSTIVCKSMEHPHRIVGFNIAHALVDEIDCMPIKKADSAWKKIIARMSTVWPGRDMNTIDVTTTPEGFNWVYRKFVKELASNPSQRPLYGIVHASTRQNAKNLPKDYIKSLRESYPANLVDAYIDGLFVNLTSGSVYPSFCRKQNHTDATIRPGEQLHIGMDFNINRMAATIHVIRDGLPMLLEEATSLFDTPAMIVELKRRFPGHSITVYPDASGKNRKSVNGSESDHSLLRAAGFMVMVNPSNPMVRDRVLAVNAMFLNIDHKRRYLVNTDNCPVTTQVLEQQAYDEHGQPNKDGTEDPVDALGYFIVQRFPIAGSYTLANVSNS
ncbi:terminase [Pseudomonas sp. MF6772]|uniref:terminase large subunit domain-containing protein n=1 Tax=unclassified Pseudomonas TaxID=196821 RepID=UPI00147569FE|nr:MULTISPECIES: terminase family protein [unclassified Pseudomonas]MBJ2270458.1 terminase [Pseudomonas sp. MF6772]MBL7231628.1 terminase [Pseudomonas sp.]NMY32697.1 terminase [Pseudomonas sp. WS 5412]WLI32876.1 terminase family protein [Pseudomonas sp. FP818]